MTFGHLVSEMDNQSYRHYLVPGLMMMAMITNSFGNVVGSVFMSKFQKSIEEILISPMSSLEILTGFVAGGVIRGLLNGFFVYFISFLILGLIPHFPVLTLSFSIALTCLFSCAGLINGLMAKKFDDINIIPTFIINPLIYLSGVFYSVEILNPFWRKITYFNPFFYMASGLRFCMLGDGDIALGASIAILLTCTLLTFILAWFLVEKRYGLGHDG
jgi:ABC-2 type transport system permease protein